VVRNATRSRQWKPAYRILSGEGGGLSPQHTHTRLLLGPLQVRAGLVDYHPPSIGIPADPKKIGVQMAFS